MTKLFNLSFVFMVGLLVSLSFSQNNVGETAPNFYLKDLQGKSHFLNDYCGEKKSAYKKNEKNVVLLSFFASWCVPCKAEYAILEKLASHYAGKKVKIFLINIEEEKSLVRKYIKEQGIALPVLLDKYGVAKKKYKISSIPQVFLIDPRQHIVWQKNGYDEKFPLFETLNGKIDALLIENFGEK